nr:MAG TPA: baseplate protein [Caudoviricetes sp.]DAG25367.1 MAG TPA: baseplate protein [Bacteriophage sp.]
MEYVEQFAETSTTKAQEAAESATAAERAKTDTLAAKTEAVQVISAEKQAGLDAISTAKSNAVKETQSAHTAALQDISNARAGALDDVAASTKKATDAASTAAQKAEEASTNAADAQQAKTNAEAAATAAGKSQTAAETAQKKAEAAAELAGARASTDKTFTIEDAPADAKAVGEALKNLNIRPATATTLGGVKLSEDFTADEDGTLHLAGGTALDPYPVGSIYQSTDAASPAALFGGTWEQIAQDRVLMGASDTHPAGSTAEAGLPNITGSMVEGTTDQGPFRTEGYLVCEGAFRGVKKSNSFTGHPRHEGGNYDLYFDASASNAVYGASDTVQPPAYYVYTWRRIE